MIEDLNIDAIEEQIEIQEDLHECDEFYEIENILKEYMTEDEFNIEFNEDEIINELFEDVIDMALEY